MTLDELHELVARGESESLEFKRSTSETTRAMQAGCGMLNAKGGRVLFGIDDRGQVVGQPTGRDSLASLANEANQFDPPVAPEIEAVEVTTGKHVIVVTFEAGGRRPYTFKGRAFKRVGASTVELPREQYNKLLLEQLHGTDRWESGSAPGWVIEDLDSVEILKTLDESIRRGRVADPGTRDPEQVLSGFGLTRNGTLLRAAVVLFARATRLLPDFPQCTLRIARFRGIDKTDFWDNRQFHGNIFDLLPRAERYLRENLPVAGRVVPNLFERQDDPLYPPLALREALANAFAHRDYSVGGGAVAAGIYDDRLEITSTGSLHFGLTVKDLYRAHASQPWNPLIADVLYKRGIIETWGRGTIKIAELTERAGLPRPEFEEIPGALVVRFRPSRYVAPQRIGHDLSARQQDILRVLGGHERLPLRQIRSALTADVAVRTLRDDLSFLRTLEMVENRGWGRGAVWSLKGF